MNGVDLTGYGYRYLNVVQMRSQFADPSSAISGDILIDKFIVSRPFDFVPAFQRTVFTQWRAPETGGGFVRIVDDDDPVLRQPSFGRLTLENGDSVIGRFHFSGAVMVGDRPMMVDVRFSPMEWNYLQELVFFMRHHREVEPEVRRNELHPRFPTVSDGRDHWMSELAWTVDTVRNEHRGHVFYTPYLCHPHLVDRTDLRGQLALTSEALFRSTVPSTMSLYWERM